MNCNAFKRSLFHFQADELTAEEREPLQRHLDDCPECAQRLAFEDSMLAGLKGRLAAEPTPPGLETRIRAQLQEQSGASEGSFGWIRRPWFAALAASLLLAALLFPLSNKLDNGAVVQVAESVVVVDRACDKMGADIASQRECRHPRHLNALKRADGSYWSVSLEGAEGEALITDPEMRGRQLRVEGAYFPRIRTIQIERTEELGSIAAARGFL